MEAQCWCRCLSACSACHFRCTSRNRMAPQIYGYRALLLAFVILACGRCARGLYGPNFGKSTPAFLTDEDAPVVHVVFSNHLDVGYTDFDLNVINLYFEKHFPRAIRIANELRDQPIEDTFVYTTHCWLIALYLNCPADQGFACPSPEALSDFEKAVRQGDIVWHAFPFNAEAEMYDPELYSFALGLCQSLDDKFGLPHKITMSQRDIPGTTRGSLPILAAAGVKALTVGVNAATSPPAVPHFTPFIWRDEASAAEVITMYHPGGYGGHWHGLNVDEKEDCIVAGDARHVLCVAWRDDNQGPPSGVYEVGLMMGHLRDVWPEHRVVASTLDDYVRGLMKDVEVGLVTLNVFTGEIGDTWIHGQGSDPVRMAEHRAASRARRQCLRSGAVSEMDPGMSLMGTYLIKNLEHTWGLAIQALEDWSSWSNEQLQEGLTGGPGGRPKDNFRKMISSWEAQAAYTGRALKALPPDSPIHALVEADRMDRRVSHASVHAARSAATPLKAGAAGARVKMETKFWRLEVDLKTGSLTHLSLLPTPDNPHPANWLAPGVQFGLPLYSTYTEADFEEWLYHHYSYSFPYWASDFSKYNCSSANPRRADLQGILVEVNKLVGDAGLTLMLGFVFDTWAVVEAGAPAEFWVTYFFSNSTREISMSGIWLEKTPTRLPEALWLRMQPDPLALEANSWRLHKLATQVSPYDVVRNGSQSLHAVSEEGGVSVRSGPCSALNLDADSSLPWSSRRRLLTSSSRQTSELRGDAPACETLRLKSLDVPLVGVGAPFAMPSPDRQPDMSQGVSWNLVNNVWGTNFVMWVPYMVNKEDVNVKFRFTIDVESKPLPWSSTSTSSAHK